MRSMGVWEHGCMGVWDRGSAERPYARTGWLAVGLGLLLSAAPGCRSVAPDGAGTTTPGPGDSAVRAGSATAPEALSEAVLPLTFEAAVARAVHFSEDITRYRAAVTVARERVLASGDWRDPELRLSYGSDAGDLSRERLSYEAPGGSLASREVPAGATGLSETVGATEDDGHAFRVAVRFFTTNPWQKAAFASGRAGEYALAKAEKLAAEWELSLDVQRLYGEIHHVREDLKLATRQKELRRSALEAARSRVGQGIGTVQDIMDASRRLLGIVSNSDRENRRLRNLLGQLSGLTRLSLSPGDVDTAHVDIEPGSVPVVGVDLEALAEQAVGERDDIAAMVWRSRVAAAAYRESRASRIPWFNHVQASFQSATEESESRSSSYRAAGGAVDYDFTKDDGDAQEWRIDAAVSLPVFYWMNRDRHVRLAEREMAFQEEVAARGRVRFAIEEALQTLRELEQGAKQYAGETETVIREMETVIKDDREGRGILPPEDIARLEEEILDARRARLEARYDYNMAVISLQEALGRRL